MPQHSPLPCRWPSPARSTRSGRQRQHEIEEVVVTAQKREENMQDVAISMSAMDATCDPENRSARTIDEITGMSPNLVINPILGNGTDRRVDPRHAACRGGKELRPGGSHLSGRCLPVRNHNGCVCINVWDAERVEVLARSAGDTLWPQYDWRPWST